MEQLLLSDYLVACINFEKEQSEEHDKIIKDFLNKLTVKSYLGFRDKEINMMSTLSTIPADYDAIAAAGQYNISKIVYGLFPYAINLTNDIPLTTITFYAMDCFYNFGLIDEILKYCKEDYLRWEKMVDNSLNLDGIYKMLSTIPLLDSAEYDKWIQTMKDLKQEFTPEMIKGLSVLALDGGDSFVQLKQSLAESALDKANAEAELKLAQASKLEEKIQNIQNDIREAQEGISEQDASDDEKKEIAQETTKNA